MGQAFRLDRMEVENARGMVDVEADGAPLLIEVEPHVRCDLAGVDAGPPLELDIESRSPGSRDASRRLLLEVAVGERVVHGDAIRQCDDP